MLRLYDSHLGRPSEITLARPGIVRLGCPGGLRDMLVADMIRRLLELQRLRVVTYWDATEEDTAVLNIGPPEYGGTDPGDVDVHIRPGRFRFPSHDFDSLALRLAVLDRHYRSDLELTLEDIGTAAQALAAWRNRVAEWAESPSKAMRGSYLSGALDAIEDDLDTPTALALLRRLEEDGSVSPGSKFETFAYLDRVFALDLVREVGRY